MSGKTLRRQRIAQRVRARWQLYSQWCAIYDADLPYRNWQHWHERYPIEHGAAQ